MILNAGEVAARKAKDRKALNLPSRIQFVASFPRGGHLGLSLMQVPCKSANSHNTSIQLNIPNLLCRALEDLHQTLVQLAFAHGYAKRHADQVRILELHSGPLVRDRQRERRCPAPASLVQLFRGGTQPRRHPCWRRSGSRQTARWRAAETCHPGRGSVPRPRSGCAPRRCHRIPSPAASPCRSHPAHGVHRFRITPPQFEDVPQFHRHADAQRLSAAQAEVAGQDHRRS